MNKIIRTKTCAKGGITAEEKKLLDAHAQKWIANAMKTGETDKPALVQAIKDLYGAAGLKEPRVIVVPSPRIMAFAGGFSAAIWWLRKNKKTHAATSDATHDATRAATRAATRDATDAATSAATRDATRDAPNFLQIAKKILGSNFLLGLRCAQSWWRMYQGGNMWSAWDSYLTGFRDVIGLDLPQHKKYSAWERAAQLGGFRIVHEEFCMVSEFPLVLKVDEQNRPHCADGPSHLWKDGWAFYFWHGVRVPKDVILRPESLTVAQIEKEQNTEVRRIMIDRYGPARYLKDSGAIVVHELPKNYFLKGLRGARLLKKEVPGDETIVMIDCVNSSPEPDGSYKRYMLRVDPNAYGGKAATDCHAAMASTWRFEDGSLVFPKPLDYRPRLET